MLPLPHGPAILCFFRFCFDTCHPTVLSQQPIKIKSQKQQPNSLEIRAAGPCCSKAGNLDGNSSTKKYGNFSEFRMAWPRLILWSRSRFFLELEKHEAKCGRVYVVSLPVWLPPLPSGGRELRCSQDQVSGLGGQQGRSSGRNFHMNVSCVADCIHTLVSLHRDCEFVGESFGREANGRFSTC